MNVKNILLGKPLKSAQAEGERLPIWKALPILSSDAISSVAYGTEEILVVFASAGLLVSSYVYSLFVALMIVLMIAIVVTSYRQVIDAYPQGGGAYEVTREWFGPLFGRMTASSLLIDYTLTVAVSISAGVTAITSAFPVAIPYAVGIALVINFIMVWINLRGTGEAGNIFAIPTYMFIFSIVLMFGKGLWDLSMGHIHTPGAEFHLPSHFPTQLSFFLLLSAFANGCSAATGIEAIADAVPNFRSPSAKNAKKTYVRLGLLLALSFGAVTIQTLLYHHTPDLSGRVSILSMDARSAFGSGPLFYFIQLSTMLVLILAANTSYNGFPVLTSIVARNREFPRMFMNRGDRLSLHYGIITLGVLSSILLVVFDAKTDALIPLYAIGVFLSFTLAQAGLVKKWFVEKPHGYVKRIAINATGSLVTGIVLGIFTITKFMSGAWVVVLLIPILTYGLSRISRHYDGFRASLQLDYDLPLPHKEVSVIVPIAGIHKVVANSIGFAKTLSPNAIAFYVAFSAEEEEAMKEKWASWNPGIRLVVHRTQYRSVIQPTMKYIDRVQQQIKKGDTVMVVLPKFETHWIGQHLLHNNIAKRLYDMCNQRDDVVVCTVSYNVK